jgi:hypothetical protein
MQILNFIAYAAVCSVPVCMCACKVLGTLKDDCGINANVYVVQFNGFMSLIR